MGFSTFTIVMRGDMDGMCGTSATCDPAFFSSVPSMSVSAKLKRGSRVREVRTRERCSQPRLRKAKRDVAPPTAPTRMEMASITVRRGDSSVTSALGEGLRTKERRTGVEDGRKGVSGRIEDGDSVDDSREKRYP
jgi:hypothetical protein